MDMRHRKSRCFHHLQNATFMFERINSMIEFTAIASQIKRHRSAFFLRRLDEEGRPPAGLPLERGDLHTQLIFDPGKGALPFGLKRFAGITVFRRVGR